MEQAAQEQAAERSRLGKLKEEVDRAQASHTKLVSEETARLEAREKTLAVAEKAAATGRDAFVSLELRSRTALQSLYGEGYKKPLELEGIVAGVGTMVEGECDALFTSAATRVFNHLHLRNPSFDLGALIELVAPESHDAAAEAVEKQVRDLLEKFLYIDPAAATTGAGSEDGGGVVDDELPAAGDVGNRGNSGASS
ncbi:uncharacterized protein [Aegilops tauschii subsp. strangulata]|uniref:uncharacterized protein n=1 Tax=Aegilops tauschii subsp. strangulata TaxID=200361 RepID=UPI00098B3069|nr:uncharacterized protein LOC109766173 [Aegilops tauschii subsp. strangulata]